MEKFIPYEKLSKKKQRELNAKHRRTWGGLNPTTRKPESSKAYRRCKLNAQYRKEKSTEPGNFRFCASFFGLIFA